LQFILGINEFTHDTSACLLSDGEIIGACEEERFTREKHSYGWERGGSYPKNAISWLLNKAGIDHSDLRAVALGWNRMAFSEWCHSRQTTLSMYKSIGLDHPDSKLIISPDQYAQRIEEREAFILNFERYTKVFCFDHHLCHAREAFVASNFDARLIIVIDGSGGDKSTSVWSAKNSSLALINSYPLDQSIGTFYALVTRILGFGRDNEGKTMALAALAEPCENFTALDYNIGKDKFEFNFEFLKEIITRVNKAKTTQESWIIRCRTAATVQRDLNYTLCRFFSHFAEKTGEDKIAYSGGVALNCVSNGFLHRKGLKIQTPPAPNDSGVSLGAAFEAVHHLDLSYKPGNSRFSALLGPKFDENELLNSVELAKLKVTYISNTQQKVISLLRQDGFACVVKGKLEFGPRALGNRSILADISSPGIVATLNSQIKHRESWRPFGIAIQQEKLRDYFGISRRFPYMDAAFSPRGSQKNIFRNVLHQDGSIRIQTVCADDNYWLYNLLGLCGEIFGIPALINTSLNVRSQPIVNSINDVLSFMEKTEAVRHVLIGNYLVSK